MNVVSTKTINAYCKKYPEASNALRKWNRDIEKASFENFNQLKEVYGNASLVGDNRVIFNVVGNHFRLIVRVSFLHKNMMVKWFGAHEEYDKINPTTVSFDE